MELPVLRWSFWQNTDFKRCVEEFNKKDRTNVLWKRGYDGF